MDKISSLAAAYLHPFQLGEARPVASGSVLWPACLREISGLSLAKM